MRENMIRVRQCITDPTRTVKTPPLADQDQLQKKNFRGKHSLSSDWDCRQGGLIKCGSNKKGGM